MPVSRRTFFASSVGLGVVCLIGLLGSFAAAATPSATSVASGVARVDLGSVVVTMLHDGFFNRPLDANFVTNASLDEVQAALSEAGLPTDRVEVPLTPLVVDVGDQRVLFDAGNGDSGRPNDR
jgi:hypothetical protein